MTDCRFFYDRFGTIRDAKDPRRVLWRCDDWGRPWNFDLSTSNTQPTTWEKWAGELLGEHFVRHIITVEVPVDRIEEAIPVLKQFPDLRTVVIFQESERRHSEGDLNVAVEAVTREIPSVAVEALQFDDKPLFSESPPLAFAKDIDQELPKTTNFRISDSMCICWSDDTTEAVEAVVDTALWTGLILDFCHL
jgi:hypothetical protein